jgi:hypothetical protein
MEEITQTEIRVLGLEIVQCCSFEDKLKKWADFTVNYCDNVARTKINRTFYVFQSEPKQHPDILILGFNPYGTHPYNAMFEHEHDGWGLNGYGRMTSDVIIHQNPWYIGGTQSNTQQEWNILKNLNKTITVHPELERIFDNMVYMNILYFNSIDFNEFKTSFKEYWKEVFEACVQLSSILIYEIIKPKKIICLGINNCYKPFVGTTPTEMLVDGALCKCEINGFGIYGMTHPSARTTNVSKQNIGWHLYSDWFNLPLMNGVDDKLVSIQAVFSLIADKYRLKLDFETEQMMGQFGFFKFTSVDKPDISIYFEFQKSFYSDLRFGLHKNGFINGVKKCMPPYNNWTLLAEKFNCKEFENYFEGEIKSLLPEMNII